MLWLADWINALNRAVAQFVRWFAVAMALIQFGIVIGRYIFGVNSIWLQESVLYLHASLFMLSAGYTLLVDKHVRCQPSPHRHCGPSAVPSSGHGRACLVVLAISAQFLADF